MSDPAVEDVARATYLDFAARDDPQLEPTRQFVEVNDLLERNVMGAMSSNFHFYRGMAEGGALEMDEGMMLADVWSQEDELRSDTEAWLYGFLLMAYRPLEPADLKAYIVFSETAAGQALNSALFEEFDVMFGQISYGMGLGLGRAMMAHEL